MSQQFNIFANKKAFTLVELIIYVAISAIVLVSTLNFGMNLILGNVKARAQHEVYANSRLIMNNLQNVIRAADALIVGSSGVHPGTLNATLSGSTVLIDTYTKNVTIGGQLIPIRKLQIKQGTGAYVDLTSDKVNVTNFIVTDLQRGSEKKNVNVALNIHRVNPGNDPKYDASIAAEIALSLRK